MDYSKLGNNLVKLEKIEEKKEEDTVLNAGVSSGTSIKPEIREMTDSQRSSSRVFTGFVRKGFCAAVEKFATATLKWKMDGYSERVDNDPIVVEAFHTTAEKRIPAVLVASPEAITVCGLTAHAYATNRINKEKEAQKKTDDEIVHPVKTEDDEPVYATEEDFPIDIGVHDSTKPVVDVDVDDFGFKNSDGEFVEAPKSIMDSLFTGRKRQRTKSSEPKEKRAYKKKKTTNTLSEDVFE